MESIFTAIRDNVRDDALVSLISAQIGKLSSADQQLTDLIENPPSGLSDLTSLLDGFSIPDLDRSGILSQGFSSLKNLIPTDPTDFTGELTGAIDQLFADLNVNLVGKLSKIVEAFRAIYELSQTEFSLTENVSGENPGTRQLIGSSVRAVRAGENNNDNFEEAFNSVSNFLDLLPDPLTVANLLGWILEILQLFPRHLYPLRYLPFLDELHDKLETILAWREMDGSQLSSHLAASLNTLRLSIQDILITEGIQPLADRIAVLSGHIDRDTIMNTMNTLISGLTTLADRVRSGDLSGTADNITELNANLGQLQTSLAVIKTNLLAGQVEALNRDLAKLGDTMNGRILQLLSNLNPPSDLEALSALVGPANRTLDEVGFEALNSKISEFLGSLQNLIDQLNLTSVKDVLNSTLDPALAAADELNKILIKITVDFSLLIGQMENAIDALHIEQIVAEMEKTLEDFQKLVKNGVNTIFEPVRNLLNNTFSLMNNYISYFNPRTVIEDLMKLIRNLTDILSNPQLLDVIDSLHDVLDTINEELHKFSFKPVTDTVVEAIEIVEDTLKTASAMPLPDSLKSQLSAALRVLPPTIDPVTDRINSGLKRIIDEGPKPILSEIKEQPAKLVEVVRRYSPDQLIGDRLSEPYGQFVDKMEEFRPSDLLRPVQEALERLKTQVDQYANPAQFLSPLEEPFNGLVQSLNEFKPEELIQPIQQQFQTSLQSIISQLPLEETNAVFDQIKEITDRISAVMAVGFAFRDLLQEFKDRLAGLAGAEVQIQTIGSEVSAKLDQVEDITAVRDAMSQVESDLDAVKATPLRQILETPLEALIAKLDGMKAKNRLVDLIAVQRGFPRQQLEALPASAEKTAMLSLLDGFDPMGGSFTVPLDALDTWLPDLQTARTDLVTLFSDWDNRYHGPHSPLSELRKPNISIPELKGLLTETVRQQLTELLTPIFKVVNHLQNLLASVLSELIVLLDDLQAKVEDFLSISDSLEELRQAVNGFIATLEGFDISFLAVEIQSLFDGLKAKLDTLNPTRIATVVGETFDELLRLLDINKVLEVDQLNRNYEGLLETLKSLDPKTLVTDQIQPEYDKILVFLEKFDLTEPIDAFLSQLTSLQQELELELARTAESYNNMMDAVPSDVGGARALSIGVGGGI